MTLTSISMPNNNILYIVSSLERGGLELRLFDFASRFPDAYTIHICVTSDRVDLIDKFKKTKARILIVPINKAYFEYGNLKKIKLYVIENNIKVINTYDFKGLIVGCLLKMCARPRVALIHNTVDLLHNYKFRHKFIIKFLFRYVDRSICNSVQARDILVSLGVKNSLIDVINNGVDLEIFRPDSEKRHFMRSRYGIADDEMVIGTVANFRWEKNYPFLIESFSELISKYTKLKLLCVGGGDAMTEIMALAKESGVYDMTLFPGAVDNVHDYLGMMDIFVLCSLKESFPNSVIQAMSMRLPVIVPNIGACNDIVSDGVDGFIYKVKSKSQFLERIEKLLLDKTNSSIIASFGNKKVKECFSINAMITNYINLYDRVITY